MADGPGLFHGRGAPEVPDFGGRLPVALMVPGGYGPALSSLGWQAAYRLLAASPRLAVERFFLDHTGDDEPRGTDTGLPLSHFPVLAASLTFEEELLRLPKALSAPGVPPLAAERPAFPLLVAGGPLAFLNPAPLARFIDLAWVGEAEAGLLPLFEALAAHVMDGRDKQSFLEAVKDRPGVWVPGRTKRARRVLAPDLSAPAFSCFTGPEATFKDALLVEVNRGCPHACRFCAAGHIYRPPRQARLEDLQAIVEHCQPQKVGLVGTDLTGWADLLAFLAWLKARRIKFSLSSMRADGLTEDLLTFLRGCGVRTVTLALEGPSQRLRRMASKHLDADTFLAAVERCARLGVNHLRIYCIVGWPGETDADYEELAAFLAEVDAARTRGHGNKKQRMRLTVGASCLVPKPWTPFQWAPMADEASLEQRLRQVKAATRPVKACAFSGDVPWRARLQGLIARGGEDIADLVLLSAEHGGWKQGLKRWEGDASDVLDRERGEHEAFPWECIDTGIDRGHLYRQWLRAKQCRTSFGCRPDGCEACRACGMQDFLAD